MSNKPPSPFGWLKAAIDAFFRQDLKLHRDRGGVRVVLAGRDGKVDVKPTRAERSARRDEADLELARADLAALLDEEATNRSRMRHLALVEHALEKKGWRGLYKVPLDVLMRAHGQLEDTVTNWSAPGLATLRSRMAVTVLDREQREGEEDIVDPKTAAVLDNPPVLAAQAIDQARASSAAATEVIEASEDEGAALLAAYAAMGMAPAEETQIEVQGNLRKQPA